MIAALSLLTACLPAIGASATSPSPSPAASKTNANPPAITPRFSPAGGIFAGRTSVNVESPAPNGVVRYTVDGSEPTASSPVFLEAFNINRTTLVRARVFRDSRPLGPPTSQTYTVAAPSLGKYSGNLPVLVINLFGQDVQREPRKVASLNLIDAQNGRTTLVGAKGLDVRAEVWWRGRSSLRYLKRSLGVKTRDESGKARSLELLGLPADSDWVLYAPYPDKTLIRDVLAYELSNQMGQYASRTRFVEVFLNEGTGRLAMEHYMGVYVLEEKIKRAPSRINVQKLGTNDNAEPAITGGYVFKKDHEDTFGEVEPTADGRPNFGGGNSGSRYGYPTGPGGFPGDPRGFMPTMGNERQGMRGRNQTPFRPGLPPPEVGGFEREMVIRDGRGRTIERQVGREGRGPEIRSGFMPGRVWSPMGSAVEEVFVTDFGNEFYYVEPKEDEITAPQRRWLRAHLNEFERVLYGPTFTDPKKGYAAYIDVDSFIDYHLIVEVTKNIDGFRFSTFYHKDRGGRIKAQPIWDWNLSFGNANGKQGWMPEYWYWPQLDDQQYSYYRRLFEDPDFGQRYVDRWGQCRATVFSDSNVLARIDAHVATLGDARIRNFSRWPILGQTIWPNYYVGATYEDEIRYMKDWVRRRLAWIDAQFTSVPRASVVKSGANRDVTLTAGRSQVYYTLDGTDPRAPGGQPSTRAAQASGPAVVKPGMKLVARAVFEGRWSSPVGVSGK